MANKADLEKLFHEKFKDFSPELSPNALDNLDSKLNRLRYIKIAKWFLITSAILLSSWLAFEMLDSNESELTHNQSELVLPKTQNTNAETSIEENYSPSESVFNQNESSEKTEINTIEALEGTKEKSNSQSEEIITDLSKSKVKASETNSAELALKPKQVSEDTEEVILDKKEELLINDENSTDNIIESEENIRVNSATESPLLEENESFSLEDAIQETLAEELGTAVTVEIEDKGIKSKEGSTSVEGKNKDNSKENKKAKKSKKNKAKNVNFAKTKDRSSEGTQSKRFNAYLDLHTSGYVFNNTAASPSLYSDSLTSTAYTQTPQLSHEFGIGVQLKLKDQPWLLYTGIDYQVFKEKIDYKWSQTFEDQELSYWNYDSTFSIEQVIDTFFIIVDSNHFVIDTLYTQDTLLTNVDSAYNAVMSTDEKAKKHINTYTYLNIPLMIGYEFQTANKDWSFQVLGGAAVAINLSNEGYYYSKDGGIQEYSGKVNPSLTWRLMAAANINYQWKKWQFYLQPEFQYQLNESEVMNQDIRRKYQIYKVKAGIRFKIF